MKIKLDNRLIDKIAIYDLVLSVGYIFLINFFNYVDSNEILVTLLLIMRYVTVVIFLLVLALVALWSREKRRFILVFGMTVFLVTVLQILIFPTYNSIFIETARNYILTIARIVILFYIIENFNYMVICLRNYSRCVAVFLIIELFVKGVSFNNGRYSMALGYICLFPAMILIYCFNQKRRIIDLIAALAIIISITMYASRGPLLCIILFVTLSLLRNSRSYITIGTIILIIIVYANIGMILDTVSRAIPNLGNSRTIFYAINSRITEDSGRIGMYERIWVVFVQNPLALRGINSDYSVLGVYTHNLFLELLYEFGIIIGGSLCLYITIRIIRELLTFKSSAENEWYLMLMTISIPQLMVSHTVWTEWTFWVWIILGPKLVKPRFLKSENIRKNAYEVGT